jgi:hypothetical protein
MSHAFAPAHDSKTIPASQAWRKLTDDERNRWIALARASCVDLIEAEQLVIMWNQSL